MDIRKLQRAIVDGLEDVKAQNIVVFNTEHLSALFERVIVASGTSNRQTKSLASSVREAVKAAGAPPPRMEGEANGEWIIVDCGAAVVHVMQPAIREYYHLEELWGDKPVKMKFGAAAPRLVKAESTPSPSARRRTGTDKAGATADGGAGSRSGSLRSSTLAGPASVGTKSPARAAGGARGTSPAGKTSTSTGRKGSTAGKKSASVARKSAPSAPKSAPAARKTGPAAKKRAAGTAKHAAGAPASRAGPSRGKAPMRPAPTPGVVRTSGGRSAAAKSTRPPAKKATGR